MDAFLGSITQHAMNYAIRSGIAITSTYAIRQCTRLLRTVEDVTEFQELQTLQERLDGKIRIISPAIDMIELISARGNTTLESAVTLTKGLRWDIQSLGTRLAKAASAEEVFRRDKKRAKPRPDFKAELRYIVQDIKKLLLRIEDAVPLINLAITTSGASLSTSLPPTVSPSRLLQASTCLTAGDTQFSIEPTTPVQVGPAFVLSVYMLFAGHTHRTHDKEIDVRDTTWKEVIHKARVKLTRVPLRPLHPSLDTSYLPSGKKNKETYSSTSMEESSETEGMPETWIPSEGKESEFAYQLVIIEDLNDGRVHSFEENEPQPEPYEDVQLAGIKEFIPIHQFSKIFYADTGKILNIGTDPEVNSPVLLLKRDINASHPRQMMEQFEQPSSCDLHHDAAADDDESSSPESDLKKEESQADIDEQLRSESSFLLPIEQPNPNPSKIPPIWRFPPDLDFEWLALEAYTDVEDDNSDEDQDTSDDSAYVSGRPSYSREGSLDSGLDSGLANLRLQSVTPESPFTPEPHQISTPVLPRRSSLAAANSLFGPVRSSLSLLEMLIRLMALQQYKQTSHLAIPDELLNFFLLESSTSGAGANGEQRRRTRFEAKQKVGFDPYDDSPMKPREDGQAGGLHQNFSRGGTPYSEYDTRQGYYAEETSWPRERGTPPREPQDRWLLRSRENSVEPRQHSADIPSSPMTPYVPRRAAKPLDHIRQARRTGKAGSSLGRGTSVETDSSLGTSPGTRGTPVLGERDEGASSTTPV